MLLTLLLNLDMFGAVRDTHDGGDWTVASEEQEQQRGQLLIQARARLREQLRMALEGPQPELVQEVRALIPETEMPIGLSKERVAELFAELDRILAHHQELARAELEDEEDIVLMAGLH